MIVTTAEVKTILNLTDTFYNKESVTMDTVNYKRLTNKNVVEIHRVDTDTQWSTGSAYTTLDYYATEDYEKYTLIRRIDTGSIGDTETVYVSYAVNTYDDLIDTLIPQVQADVLDYLNNYFMDRETQYDSGSFKIIERSGTSHPQITDTANKEFLKWGFQANMDITVIGTPRNNGVYTISALSSEVMKLSSGDTLLEESATVDYGGNVIQINRIKWPVALKRAVAQIIWFNINRMKNSDISSKSIGPTSVTYQDLGSGGYPPSLYAQLNKFKNHKMK